MIQTKCNNIGFHQPLSDMLEEYTAGSEIIKGKIRNMEKTYGGYRRSRGDGNCYYRAAAFLFLEQGPIACETFNKRMAALAPGPHITAEVKEAVEYLQPFVDGTGTAKWDEKRWESFYKDTLVDPKIDTSIVWVTRAIAAQYAQKNADVKMPNGMSLSELCIALGHADLDAFINDELLKWGVEAESAVQAILPKALGIPMQIVQLDRSEGEQPTVYDFEAGEGAAAPAAGCNDKIYLLFKPGHYDMLYSKEQGASAKAMQTLELQKFCRTPWECSICCDEEGEGTAEIIKPWLCDDAICTECDEPFAECPTCKAKRREGV